MSARLHLKAVGRLSRADSPTHPTPKGGTELPDLVNPNPYSAEDRVRQDLVEILAEHEYEIDSYALADKSDERTLTVRAKKGLEVRQATLKFNTDLERHPDGV
jgi:hypothetical protein